MEESNKASSPDKAGLSRAMKTAIAAAGLAALVFCGVLFGVLFATGVLGDGSESACGFAISFDDKAQVCVEVPPKIVESSRRLGSLQGRRASEAEEQSMKFYCREGSSPAAKAQCELKCNADMIYVSQVFLVEDEDDNRESWVGGHVQVVIDEIPQTYSMDYSRGCSDKADYLAQDFSDRTKFNCGLSEIGFDLHFRLYSGEICPTDETIQVDGITYCYATMDNLYFGTFLQDTLKKVQDGTLCPGIHTQGFAKEYDDIVDLCVAEFKVNFVIPASEAPEAASGIGGCNTEEA